MERYSETFKGKRVLVTGHSGFKGTWMLVWLEMLGAEVYGISLPINSGESHYRLIKESTSAVHSEADIRDLPALTKAISDIRPHFVFHLAAQAIVKASYTDPYTTWTTNVIGTLNVLEALRQQTNPITAIFITSDKCYENKEWEWGYRETDQLGGSDPYSASKASAELVVNSYVRSFLSNPDSIHSVCTARAGNVIGGGDWSEARLIPDCVRSWANSKAVVLRNPHSTRPWQHVLEPISGYLRLAAELSLNRTLHGEAFNFGPATGSDYSVLEVVQAMAENWEKVTWQVDSSSDFSFKEACLLKLNCDKAYFYLKWQPTLTFEETMKMTADWYKEYYSGKTSIIDYTRMQIKSFTAKSSIKIS